jgi:hypothetical protein
MRMTYDMETEDFNSKLMGMIPAYQRASQRDPEDMLIGKTVHFVSYGKLLKCRVKSTQYKNDLKVFIISVDNDGIYYTSKASIQEVI